MADQRTVTISLPPELSRAVDEQAAAEGRTRSELAREALRQYLERRDRWERIFRHGEQVAKELGIDEEDVVEAVRDWRRTAR